MGWAGTIKSATALVLSLALFFVGYQSGKIKSKGVQLCPMATVISYNSGNAVVSVRVEAPTAAGSSLVAECLTSPFQAAQRNVCPVLALSPVNMVKGKATVPDDVFPYLHHPASPAKENFFIPGDSEWKGGRVLDSPCEQIYLTRTGSRANQPNKCVAVVKVRDGWEPINQQSYRVGYTALNTNQYQQDYPRKYDAPAEENPENQLLLPFLRDLEKLRREFLDKMGNPIDEQGRRRTATVMVANEGVLDLLLNFLCSAQATSIDLATIIVFVGDERHVALIESMGARAMYSPSMGAMPSGAAHAYLDHTFSRMMWCKTTVVYLALYAGFEVLFQDVDLVWLKDPLPFFHSVEADLVFMDDGARTPRYTPFFVNSGFYHVKHTPRSVFMFESMTKAGSSEIGQTHSHQSVLIRHISEAHHLFGLSILVLDSKDFPSGQAYHENKGLIKKIQAQQFRPFVFHMCWTDNRENKVVYFKDVGLWYLPDGDDSCSSGAGMLEFALQRSGRRQSVLDHCCQRGRYWAPGAGRTD